MEQELVVLGGVVVGIWALLLWLSVVIWVYRDIRDRSRSISFQVASVLLVFLFNLAGLFLYLIVRQLETARMWKRSFLVRIGPADRRTIGYEQECDNGHGDA